MAGILSLAAAVTMSAAAAGTAGAAPASTPLPSMCDGKGVTGGICIVDKAGSLTPGNPIIGNTEVPGDPSQQWIVQATSACGDGHVHSGTSCPFNPGSGMNAEFNGDPIVTLCLQAHPNLCIANNNPAGRNLTLQSNTATGTNFVQDGYSYVNKTASNDANSEEYMTTDGNWGTQLFDHHPFVETASQWGYAV